MINKVVIIINLKNFFRLGSRNNAKSPTAIKMLKFGFNLIDDGLVGQQVYAGEATS